MLTTKARTKKKQPGKTTSPKGSFEARLIASARQAVAIERGELAPAQRYTLPRTARQVDVAAPKAHTSAEVIRLRKALGLSQTVFARALGKSPPTIRSWEQGDRTPDPAANRLLEIAARHPRVILELVTPNESR